MAPTRRKNATPPPSTPAFTGAIEDYLKTIYALEQATGTAATNDIARRLDIAPPSVTWMVRRLATQGLVEYERYRGARLTALGHRAALKILRRHRIIETFLVRQLGYPWDKVDAEAERLEHAASDELVDRMAAMLNEPKVDPHGAPIPTRQGTIAETIYQSIADLAVGDRAEVVRISDDEDPERLRYLAKLGLIPGATVVVLTHAPFEGPITVRVGRKPPGAERSIGPALARAVLVAPNLKPGRTQNR